MSKINLSSVFQIEEKGCVVAHFVEFNEWGSQRSVTCL